MTWPATSGPAAAGRGTAGPSPLWFPESGCGPRCLPEPGTLPAAGRLRVAARLACGFAVLLIAVASLPLLALGGPRARLRATGITSRALLRALGVAHDLHGRIPRRSALIAANHVSWLDVLVLAAHAPVRLVAKREVQTWPLIGKLAGAAGTLYLDRSRPRTLPETVSVVESALRSGSLVAVFPEGTTWCGADRGAFRPALFQAALGARARVVPVTLRFSLPNGTPTAAAAFVGDDDLVSSIRRIASVRGLRASLHAHPGLLPHDGDTRRTLARDAQFQVMRGARPHVTGPPEELSAVA
jgi:1-acyl-sn-glycerol-3-phosphate acyltransferase